MRGSRTRLPTSIGAILALATIAEAPGSAYAAPPGPVPNLSTAAAPAGTPPDAEGLEDGLEEEEEELAAEGSADDATADGIGIGKAPATRYGRMTASTCLREAKKRKLPVVALGEVRGIPIPVRIAGEMHGVKVHSALPKAQWATSPYEIVDCRLALAIDDFTELLARHDIVELVHMSAYRPPSKKWPAGKPGKRHGAGMALDAAIFVKKDGTRLIVEKHFKGHRRSAPCPRVQPASWAHRPTESKEIRSIFCEARENGVFHVMLSPNFNWAHRNHFHLEVAAHPRWFYVR